MTMIAVAAGIDPKTGEMTTRLEHPFFLTQGRRTRDYGDVVLVEIDGKQRHRRIAVGRSRGMEVSKRTGLPRAYTGTDGAMQRLDVAVSRQVRRQQERRDAKFTQLGQPA